eukprot:8324415-Alexandrium_andersonii.AAC.1
MLQLQPASSARDTSPRSPAIAPSRLGAVSILYMATNCCPRPCCWGRPILDLARNLRPPLAAPRRSCWGLVLRASARP